ncbi:MAG: pyridoxal-phosphate dependent enzyme [bacterium]
MLKQPTIIEIREAHARIRPHINYTPVLTCSTINQICNTDVYFKCENFQKVGAFKIRGATNAVFCIGGKDIQKGVATHSSGNHAAALAFAAGKRGAKAYIVMPRTAPKAKKQAVSGYGGIITYCEPTLKARESALKDVVKNTGACYIPSYNDPRIIEGQGTAALELLNDIPELDTIIAPVGGGGLLSGTAITSSFISPETKVIGAEPEMADDAYRSFKSGKLIPSENPGTIADGLLTPLGSLTFQIIRKNVHDIVTIKEDEIIKAMRFIWERMKIIIEPSSAVAVAALLFGHIKSPGKKVGIILSGGNVDLDKLPWK